MKYCYSWGRLYCIATAFEVANSLVCLWKTVLLMQPINHKVQLKTCSYRLFSSVSLLGTHRVKDSFTQPSAAIGQHGCQSCLGSDCKKEDSSLHYSFCMEGRKRSKKVSKAGGGGEVGWRRSSKVNTLNTKARQVPWGWLGWQTGKGTVIQRPASWFPTTSQPAKLESLIFQLFNFLPSLFLNTKVARKTRPRTTGSGTLSVGLDCWSLTQRLVLVLLIPDSLKASFSKEVMKRASHRHQVFG